MILKAVEYLQRRKFLSNVLILAGGSGLGQLFMILSSPVLTRLFSPSDYGILGLYLSFVGIASILSSLRYEMAIVSAHNDEDAATIVLASIYIIIINSTLATIIFYHLTYYSIGGFGVFPIITIGIILPAIIAISFFNVLKYWLIRKGDFKTISQVSIIQSGSRVITQLILGLFQMTWIGLLLGDLFSRFTGTTKMKLSLWVDIKSSAGLIDLRSVLIVAKKYYRFPLYVLPSSLINTLALNLPVPLITHLYNLNDAGYFALVQGIIAVPLSLIINSVADAFHNHILIYLNSDPKKARAFFIRTSINLLLIGIGPVIMIIFLGPWLFEMIFGESWRRAGILVTMMTPWILAQFIVVPISRVILVTEKQQNKLFYDVTLLLGVIIILYVGRSKGYTLEKSIMILSIFNSLAYILYYLILLRVISPKPLLPEDN